MALPATLVWEIRPTNGTANSGGGFDPSVASAGTDFSQQNAVQVSYTDLVIGVTTTQVTSALSPFTSAHVGNNLAITAGTGFTAQIFNIRSVSGVTATLDRSAGVAASTGGTGNLGGARNGFSTGTRTAQASIVTGNKAWIKNEAWNEAVSLANTGAGGSPIVLEGYNTVRGDAPTGSTRPVNDRASAAGDAITIKTNTICKYLMATRAGDAGFSNTAGAQSSLYFCRAYNNTNEGFENANNEVTLFACEFDGNGGYGVLNHSSAMIGCYVHGNTLGGVLCNSNSVSLLFNIISSNSGIGIDAPGVTSVIMNNTVNGNTGATTDGYSADVPVASHVLINNIFSNNGRYGVAATDGDSILVYSNSYFGNVTAARSNVPSSTTMTTIDPQFTSSGTGDFSIGKNLRANAYPGAFPGATSVGYLDPGAVQRQEPNDTSYGFVS